MPVEPIDPKGITWTRVDERFITVQLITGIIGWGITLLIAATIIVMQEMDIWFNLPDWLRWPVVAILLIWAIVEMILIPRRARAIGYHEREDDLLIRKGILFQRVLAVPYGRLQYVDIQSGPLMRRFGLCTLELKTASTQTEASIPGIIASEGARLREELSSRGQARLAGL